MESARCFKYIICSLVILLTFGYAAWAQSVAIQELINEIHKHDGKRVLIEGEAIGHVMKRGEHAWFNINDTTASMGVWAKAELADQIKFLGRHAVRGDIVRIDGVYYGRCPMHGGDADIHAHSMVIVKGGAKKELGYDQRKVNLLVFLIGLMVCLYIIKTLKSKR